MNKIIRFDLSEKRLLSLVSHMVEEHNYLGALRLLNKNAQINGNGEESYMAYAEIFDDMELYEKSINAWFKFLNCQSKLDLADAYEGLAINYMNVGNEGFAAYYYNKLLMEADDIPTESREQILNGFIPKEKFPLRFVYPPELRDYTKEISEGIDFMRVNDFENAVKSFETVDENNEKYLEARNYIAMCKVITDKTDEAEQECEKLLKLNPDNVQALSTLAAVKSEQHKYDESKRLAQKLLSLNTKNPDEIYKIATVCCENKMHAEAYGLFVQLQNELSFDCTLLYFIAVSAYNSGKIEQSLAAFEKLLTIYPNAVTARFYYENVKKTADSVEREELTYFYRLPEKERMESIKLLSVLCALPKKSVKEFCQTVDISACIKWAFDEGDVREDGELQYLAVSAAAKARLDGILKDVLLNAFYSDSLKMHIISELAARNEENVFGVVVCNMYVRVRTHTLKLGRAKRKNFISAYSYLLSRFAVIDIRNGDKITSACEKLYAALQANEALNLSQDVKSLTAAIYLFSGIRDSGMEKKSVYKIFNADKKTTALILGYLD